MKETGEQRASVSRPGTRLQGQHDRAQSRDRRRPPLPSRGAVGLSVSPGGSVHQTQAGSGGHYRGLRTDNFRKEDIREE